MRKKNSVIAILVVLSCVASVAIFLLFSSSESLAWRLEALIADIKYVLKPPEQAVFIPNTQVLPQASVTPLPTTALASTPTFSPETIVPLETFTETPTPTLTSTPLPPSGNLSGILHQFQMWNNCGPANLAMALSFWGWKGDQRVTAAFLKPNQRDKNVMPYEMEAFVEEETELEAVVRIGGDLEMIKAFIAAGYPVIAEKGFEGLGFDGWMGHYQVVSGYDDAAGQFLVQDSYKGPNLPISYDSFVRDWRAFNFTYLVVYPPERRQEVLNILGLQAYDNYNYRYAAQKAFDDVALLNGRDLYFALFNQGTNAVYLNDYAAAATAYDAAFANYQSLPESERPWRMMWYQTGPYFAYYYTGRYQDVIDLSTLTLEAMSEPILEESYYWRAKAKIASGDIEGAIEDLRKCLEVHAEFTPALDELKLLGVEP